MDIGGLAAIAGVGESEYSKNSGVTQTVLQLTAARRAIDDAGLRPSDIDGVLPSYHSDPPVEGYIANLGLPNVRFSSTLHMGGASGMASVRAAAAAVTGGLANYVLVVNGRNGRSGRRISQHGATPSGVMTDTQEFEFPYGLFGPPQWYSLQAMRHMHAYGTTSRQLGAVAVAMRKHAQRNPRALMRMPMTLEDHANSRWITSVFHILDCCIESDGAAAAIVTTTERARDLKSAAGGGPVRILGAGEAHPDSPTSIVTRPEITQVGIAKVAPDTFARAGLTPADVDVAQIYDCFTYCVISQIEQLGFCAKGEGGPFVEGGRIEIGGELPVNTHGGVLSEAHGMSGLNGLAEAVRQVRGDAGPTQVPGVRVALAAGYGDFGDGSLVLLGK
jgi:acetyl-CoA acetyltransferase